MLRGVFSIARHRLHVATGRRPHNLQARVLSAGYVQLHRTYTSAAETSTKRHNLFTLNPSQSDVAQEVLDASGESEILLSCRGHTDVPVPVRYDTNLSFPPNTRGVFYLTDKRPQRIRFRLCDSIADFTRGTDLLVKNGRKWSLSLIDMTTKSVHYRPLLDMIAGEHPPSVSKIGETLSDRRSIHFITTLAPQNLAASGQTVFDIPDCKALDLRFSAPTAVKPYVIRKTKTSPFLARTKGVFYYKQSATAPYTIGELRFRLCSDVASFAAGSDLLSPSGLPWCISSTQIFLAATYATIREQLLHEGLVKEPLPDTGQIPTISKLGQPFVVDLSQDKSAFRFQLGTDIIGPLNMTLFSNTHYSFTGRVVAHFENYPTVYLRGRRITKDPVFALRFLEFLTPVEVKNMEPGGQRPAVGKLLMRPFNGTTIPWGYAPHDQIVFRQLTKLKS